MELDYNLNQSQSSQFIKSAFNNNRSTFNNGSAFNNNNGSAFNNNNGSTFNNNGSAFGNKLLNQNNMNINNNGFNNNGFNSNKNNGLSNKIINSYPNNPNVNNNMNNSNKPPISSFSKSYNYQSNSQHSNFSNFNQSNSQQQLPPHNKFQPPPPKFQQPQQPKIQQSQPQSQSTLLQPSATIPQQRKCRNWQLNGFCERGNTCIFSHDNNSSSFNNMKSSNTLPCKFYLQNGMCTNPNCTYSHEDLKQPITSMGTSNLNQLIAPFEKVPIASNQSNKNICKFFLLGKCTKGDSCPFEHSSNLFIYFINQFHSNW